MSLRSVVMAILTVAAFIMSALAQPPELVFTVEDVHACPEDSVVFIDVYLANHTDAVAGFAVWIQLSRPDIIEFLTEVDTVVDTTYWQCLQWSGPDCLDSIQVWPYEDWDFVSIDTHEVSASPIDTTGALISGWEYVSARSLSGLGTDIKVVGIADLPNPPITPPLNVQPGGLLMRLRARVLELPPFVEDSAVNLIVPTEMIEHFGFSDPYGNIIGTTWILDSDTICFVCDLWEGDICLSWSVVEEPPPGGCDSTDVVVDSMVIIDTNLVVVSEGSVTLISPALGDLDYSGSGPDIADLVYLVGFMFSSGPPPLCASSADCDQNGEGPDIVDLICWVNWMFPPPK